MHGRVVIAIVFVALAFYIYSLYSTSTESFVYAESVTESAPMRPPPKVRFEDESPKLPTRPSTQVTTEVPRDPADMGYESAEIPERLRHPERAYSPGYVNDDTSIAAAAGVAGKAMAATEHAEQQFGPEFVQNGAEFMRGGIMANDPSMNADYSSV
jgi:hypothetical protein